MYDPAAFVGQTHVSPPERERLSALMERGFVDVFRQRHPDVSSVFSWWDYRRGDFHEGRGMRIDLVLASAPVAERVELGASSTATPARAQQPSDHAPVIVDFAD